MHLQPKRLDIFLTKQFATLFAGAFVICQFVLMMQFLWRYVDELIGKGLSLEILAQFFWYMGLMLVPQALPLAILLSSLITMGNLGESSELTAIKAAGISLVQALRSMFFSCIAISIASFVFQNYIGPEANIKLSQLLVSMKQKSPELEIPEGIFYDGIPQSNIFVHHKDLETGKLYGVTIYRMTGSYEDQAIILADSAMIQSTADKKHLLLTLWSGEWFENMQSQELGNKASVPYRRETFYHKQILMDFDADFSLTDASGMSSDARAKGLTQISRDIDSLTSRRDSLGQALYKDLGPRFYSMKKESWRSTGRPATATAAVSTPRTKPDLDSIYANMTVSQRQAAISNTIGSINSGKNEYEFRAMVARDEEKYLRTHYMQQLHIYTLTLSCMIFFFIGAPLGAIIRKGGLGLPVIISVLVFITYYILDNSGTRMVKIGAWPIWFGCLLSTGVLTPLAIFVTYKANNDSTVFNIDLYRHFFMNLLALREKRHIASKEVIINDPDYTSDTHQLRLLSDEIAAYESEHHLRRLPSVANVFFRYQPDNTIEDISARLEAVINDLSNSRDKLIMTELNHYPIIATKAHTRPFERKWMNITAAVVVPAGIFFYIRMVIFRTRLHRDLQTIKTVNSKICTHIDETISPQTLS